MKKKAKSEPKTFDVGVIWKKPFSIVETCLVFYIQHAEHEAKETNDPHVKELLLNNALVAGEKLNELRSEDD